MTRVQTLAEIRQLLESYGLSPRKSFGQNFLIDHNLIRTLIDASGIGEDDLVLEVGPGTGSLTEALLDRGCTVIACEIDRGLVRVMRDRLGDRARFTLVEGDCLQSKKTLAPAIVEALAHRPFTLVANLPFGVATPLVLELLTRHADACAMHVTLQHEVAQRLTAQPGTKQYGTLGVVAQALAQVRVIKRVPSECFWPRPDVTSAMVSIERRPDPLTERSGEFSRFCVRLFSMRRKQLGAVLGRSLDFPPGVAHESRAEQLTPGQLVALFDAQRAADDAIG